MDRQTDFSSDRHRPTWHFLPPSNWMNDPNGLIKWKGTYHLFYQYNPNGAFWGTMHWGHAISEDLVHWRHMPIALAPDPNGPDADGCFSGVAVNVNGVATLMYTGVRGHSQLPCVATSRDDDLGSWQKSPDNPIIAAPPPQLDTTIFRDHSVWKEDGNWYQVIGSGVGGIGGTALLYRSRDFSRWEFVDSLVSLDRVSHGIGRGATGWECPDFFQMNGQHVLIAAMWDHRPLSVGYFVGDYADHRFTPKHEGVLDPGASFYAPQSFTDDAGRRVMFGWVKESRSAEAQREAGWSGVMTLPRILSVLADGSLGSAPAPEVQQLRGHHVRLSAHEIVDDELLRLEGIPGDSLELVVSLRPGVSDTVRIDVLCSKDGRESTGISLDAASGMLTLDTNRSSASADVEGGVYSLSYGRRTDGPVQLRMFVDHSIIELFLNDERCITARAYPASADATEVRIQGTHAVAAVDAWEMRPNSASQ